MKCSNLQAGPFFVGILIMILVLSELLGHQFAQTMPHGVIVGLRSPGKYGSYSGQQHVQNDRIDHEATLLQCTHGQVYKFKIKCFRVMKKNLR